MKLIIQSLPFLRIPAGYPMSDRPRRQKYCYRILDDNTLCLQSGIAGGNGMEKLVSELVNRVSKAPPVEIDDTDSNAWHKQQAIAEIKRLARAWNVKLGECL